MNYWVQHAAGKPVVPGLEEYEIIVALDQPEYIPLRCLQLNGTILTRWTFTEEQRKLIADGADLFLEIIGGMPPVRLSISNELTKDDAAVIFG